jgi:hypothetical protein
MVGFCKKCHFMAKRVLSIGKNWGSEPPAHTAGLPGYIIKYVPLPACR